MLEGSLLPCSPLLPKALDLSRFQASTVTLPGAISRFLNHPWWSLPTLLRVMRHHAWTRSSRAAVDAMGVLP